MIDKPWRLEARSPESDAWFVRDTWASRPDWQSARREAFASLTDPPLDAGTCVRVVSPSGASMLRIIAADGTPRRPRFPYVLLDEDEASRRAMLADPSKWWRTRAGPGGLSAVLRWLLDRGSMWRLAREVLFECAQLALDPFMKRRPEITAARTMLETMRCHLDEGASAEELWKARDVVLKEMESVQTDSEDEAAYVEAGARICEIIREKIPLREVLVALATGAK